MLLSISINNDFISCLSQVQESRVEDDEDHGNLQLGAHHPTESGLQHSYTLRNNMALSGILPFRSSYSDKTPLSSPPDSGSGLQLDSELEIHPAPIQQSQEEVGGDHRGRHEIVFGAASALIES